MLQSTQQLAIFTAVLALFLSFVCRCLSSLPCFLCLTLLQKPSSRQQVSARVVCAFLTQRNNRSLPFVSELMLLLRLHREVGVDNLQVNKKMDILLTGEDQPQANQPN